MQSGPHLIRYVQRDSLDHWIKVKMSIVHVTFKGKHRFHVLREENSAIIFSNTDSGKNVDI
jgi:hypothetical protein